jgi:hypothetical protein
MIAIAYPLQEDQRIVIEPLSSGDRQIHAAVSAAFAASNYTPLRQLNCTVVDGVVEISGTVSSFYLKQLAQAAVLQINAGGVRNLVQVSGEMFALATLRGRSPD